MIGTNLEGIGPDLWEATKQTIYMVGVSSLLATLLGIPLGLFLFIVGPQGLKSRPTLYRVLAFVVNVVRSVPFIVLLVFLTPLTRALVGTSIGSTAAIVPLTIAAVPFLARLVESAVKEVSPGKTEAAVAMGADRLQITRKVLLPEARPALVAAVTVLIVAQIGNSAMAGVVGGGGLGDFAIRYGYQRFQTDVMIVTVVLLVVMVQAIQWMGDRLARSMTERQQDSGSPSSRRRWLAVSVALGLLVVSGVAIAARDDDSGTSGPLRVGATPVPHAEILTYVRDNLAAEAGLQLEIVEFTDYIQPNTALQDKVLDANYFQTVPYLAEQSAAAGYDFVNIGGVHLEPMGLYSDRVDDIAALPQGAQVAIPNDASNGGRALSLLADNGLLTLADTGETSPSVRDITENPKDLDIIEIEGAQLPRSLPDLDAAVINGNFAIDADLNPAEDALVLESTEGNPNVNILVARQDNQSDPRIRTLIQLLQGPEVVEFIETTYSGAVIPAK